MSELQGEVQELPATALQQLRLTRRSAGKPLAPGESVTLELEGYGAVDATLVVSTLAELDLLPTERREEATA